MTPVTLVIFENDDPTLSCFFCRSNEHVSRPFALSLYTTTGRSTWGVHKHCYERAAVPIRTHLPIDYVDTPLSDEIKAYYEKANASCRCEHFGCTQHFPGCYATKVLHTPPGLPSNIRGCYLCGSLSAEHHSGCARR